MVLNVTGSCCEQEVARSYTITETPHVITTPRKEGGKKRR